MAGVTGTNGKTTVTHLLGADPRPRRASPTNVVGHADRGPNHARGDRAAAAAGRACATAACRGRRPRGGAWRSRRHALAQHRVEASASTSPSSRTSATTTSTSTGPWRPTWRPRRRCSRPARGPLGSSTPTTAGGSGCSRRPGPARGGAAGVDASGSSRRRLDAASLARPAGEHPASAAGSTSRTRSLAAEAAVALGRRARRRRRRVCHGPAGPRAPRAGRGRGPASPPFSVMVDYAHTPGGLAGGAGRGGRLADPARRCSSCSGAGRP